MPTKAKTASKTASAEKPVKSKGPKRFSREWKESKLKAREELDMQLAAENVARKNGVSLDSDEDESED